MQRSLLGGPSRNAFLRWINVGGIKQRSLNTTNKKQVKPGYTFGHKHHPLLYIRNVYI